MNVRLAPLRTACLAATLTLPTLLAAGCSHVPLSTIYHLATFDLASADPAALRAAIRHPSALAPQPGGVKVTVTVGRQGEQAHRVHSYVLEPAEGPTELAPLAAHLRTGYDVLAYRLSDTDARAVRQLQADRREQARSGTAPSAFNLTVAAAACHRGALPAGAILSSTYLKLDAVGGYLTVVEDIDLRRELGDAALAREVPPCG